MKKNLTELVFILDRSGSMGGLEQDTIGGFNSLIEKQKKEDGKALVTTILFDDKSEMIHDRVDLQYIRSMTNEQYVTGGTTALLDAVGGVLPLAKAGLGWICPTLLGLVIGLIVHFAKKPRTN